MTTLPATIKVQNRTLKLINRSASIALYELWGPPNPDPVLYGFELHVIRVRPAETSFGKSYPAREVSPSNEQWGQYGWSFQPSQLQTALNRFHSLVANPPKRGLAPLQSLATDAQTLKTSIPPAQDFNPFF